MPVRTRSHARVVLQIPAILDGRIWYVQGAQVIAGLDRPHRHAEIQLNLVLRGHMRCHVAGGQYSLSPDSLMFLLPGQEHVFADLSSDVVFWGIVFRPRLVRRVCTTPATAVLRKSDPGQVLIQQLAPLTTRKLDALCRELHGKPIDTAAFNAGLGWLLAAAWEAHRAAIHPIVTGPGVHPAVECAARLIRTHPEPLSIGELARRCAISPSRLSRLFKQQTHVSLVRYRQQQMLERFYEIYGAGEPRTMLRAALEAGFGSYPQFHRVFRRHTGLSPSEYRKRMRF